MNITEWIGRTKSDADVIGATPCAALAATLDRPAQRPSPGTLLPALWHWLYFLPLSPEAEIGPDGHPRRGEFLPPLSLPRRMWAGSQIEFHKPLHVGDELTRISTIEDISEKSGHNGSLVFVKVRHEIRRRGETECALTERHDIVYRQAATPGEVAPAAAPAATDETWSKKWVPDAVLLFRYSALTFNSHRIHYDRRYVTEVEGYAGLIVQGPLIATLLLGLLRDHLPDAQVSRFEFRALHPLFDMNHFFVCGKPLPDGKTFTLWCRNHEGALSMEASAVIR